MGNCCADDGYRGAQRRASPVVEFGKERQLYGHPHRSPHMQPFFTGNQSNIAQYRSIHPQGYYEQRVAGAKPPSSLPREDQDNFNETDQHNPFKKTSSITIGLPPPQKSPQNGSLVSNKTASGDRTIFGPIDSKTFHKGNYPQKEPSITQPSRVAGQNSSFSGAPSNAQINLPSNISTRGAQNGSSRSPPPFPSSNIHSRRRDAFPSNV